MPRELHCVFMLLYKPTEQRFPHCSLWASVGLQSTCLWCMKSCLALLPVWSRFFWFPGVSFLRRGNRSCLQGLELPVASRDWNSWGRKEIRSQAAILGQSGRQGPAGEVEAERGTEELGDELGRELVHKTLLLSALGLTEQWQNIWWASSKGQCWSHLAGVQMDPFFIFKTISWNDFIDVFMVPEMWCTQKKTKVLLNKNLLLMKKWGFRWVKIVTNDFTNILIKKLITNVVKNGKCQLFWGVKNFCLGKKRCFSMKIVLIWQILTSSDYCDALHIVEKAWEMLVNERWDFMEKWVWSVQIFLFQNRPLLNTVLRVHGL